MDNLLKKLINIRENKRFTNMALSYHGVILLILFVIINKSFPYFYTNFSSIKVVMLLILVYTTVMGGVLSGILGVIVLYLQIVIMENYDYIAPVAVFTKCIELIAMIFIINYMRYKLIREIDEEENRRQLYLKVLDNIPKIIVVRGQDKIKFANKHTLEFLGIHSLGDINEHPFKKYLNNYEKREMEDFYNNFIKSPIKEATKVFHMVIDKQEKYFELNFLKIENENETEILECTIDITERQTIKNKLMEGENQYRKLLDTFPDAILLHKNRKIIFVNKSALDFFGVSNRIDIIGVCINDIIHEDYLEETNRRFEKINNSGTLTSRYIAFKGFKEGIVEGEINSSVFQYNHDYIISVIKDLTEVKELERRKKFLNEKLAYDELKSEFFSNITHEFKTPVNVIFSSMQGLRFYMNLGKIEDTQNIVTKYLDIIKLNSYRQLRLINNFIDLIRLDNNSMEANYSTNNIINTLDDTTYLVSEFARKRKNIQVLFDTSEEEIIAKYDEDIIERILLNLLSNAIKFTKEGGKVKVNVDKEFETIVLRVEDNGVGIKEEAQNYIFDRFRQGDKSFTRSTEGSGIGLSLVKALVQLIGGSIEVKSEYKKGSIFTVYIPVIKPEAPYKLDHIYYNMDEVRENKVEKISMEFSDIY